MKIITSESVFSGHPDKMCDQISDAILDAILEQDPNARVAVESAIKDNLVLIFGEVTTTANVNYSEIAASVIRISATMKSFASSRRYQSNLLTSLLELMKREVINKVPVTKA